MHLLDLPIEVLAQIPHHLSTLWDHYSLLRTSRLFHQISQTAMGDPSLPFDPSPQSTPIWSPHPHLLLAGMARHLADWAVESTTKHRNLLTALRGGPTGVFELASRVIGLRVSSLGALQAQRVHLLDPLTTLLENSCGSSGQAESLGLGLEEFLSDLGGAIHRDEVCNSPRLALLNYWVYTELFHHDLERALAGRERAREMPSLGPETRRRFWKYCVPNADRRDQPQEASQLGDQVMMWNGAVFEKRRRALERFWETGEVGEEEEEEEERGRRSGRRREAFVVAAVNEGAVSLRMLSPGGMEEVGERLEEIRERVGGWRRVMCGFWMRRWRMRRWMGRKRKGKGKRKRKRRAGIGVEYIVILCFWRPHAKRSIDAWAIRNGNVKNEPVAGSMWSVSRI